MQFQLNSGLCKYVGNIIFLFLAILISYLKYFPFNICFGLPYVWSPLCISTALFFFLLFAIRVIVFHFMSILTSLLYFLCVCVIYLIIHYTDMAECPCFPVPIWSYFLSYSSISPFWTFSHLLIFSIFGAYCPILPHLVMHFLGN